MFSASFARSSHIGKMPIRLPDSISCTVLEIPLEFALSFTKAKESFFLTQNVVLKGPKGLLSTKVPGFVKISNNNNVITINVEDPTHRIQRSLWGTTRAALFNNSIGILEGHLAICKFVGTGYRVTLETESNGQQYVYLKVGFPYTPKLPVPQGLTVTLPSPTRLFIEGTNLQQVKLFAAVIRNYKKPEPYKGKGIFVDNETIKLKERKIN